MTMAGSPAGSLERPALQRLFADIAPHQVDTVVVYRSIA
jgi:DNA invertase Pin-like site-specific DNA recombinase